MYRIRHTIYTVDPPSVRTFDRTFTLDEAKNAAYDLCYALALTGKAYWWNPTTDGQRDPYIYMLSATYDITQPTSRIEIVPATPEV